MAKHRTVTLLPTSVPRPFRELSASIEREFVEDAGGSGGGDQEVSSVGGHGNVELIVPTTDNIIAETEASGPKRSKKKRVTRGSKSPSVLNRLLQASRLTVEQGIPTLPTLPFITSSVTASPLEEGRDHTDFRAKNLRFLRLIPLSGKDGPIFVTCADLVYFRDGSSSSDKTDRTLSLFTRKSCSDFVAGSIRVGGDADIDLQEIYIPEWSVTKGFELKDGRSCANMIDHFTHPAFFKTVHGMEHEQLFAEFNVSAACNLSLSSEVRMHAEYNILEKRKWKSLAGEKNNLLVRATTALLKQERSALKLKVTGLESIIAEKDHELSDLGTASSSLRSQNQSLVNQYMEALRKCFGRSYRKGSAGGLGRWNWNMDKLVESYWDVMDLLRLDDAMDEVLGMTDLQPDVGQLMVPVHHKQDKVMIGSQALFVALETCHSRVRKIERNLTEHFPFLKDVFISIDRPVSAKALAILPETSTEPPVTALTALSNVVIRPNSDPFLLVEDYENPDLAGAVPEDVIPGPEGEGKVGGSTEGDVDTGDLMFSQLENEARDAVL
ncbi:hypothetical protein Tco_0940522 [Tanacetum coccineum]|uniref:Uncharacterized protein n=1 Tax=Tanacetum coccineum TaxID=301880 RepID=A0ABQ5DP00_9ASTR